MKFISRNKLIIYLLIGLLFSACRKDFLDRPPQNVIASQQAFGSVPAATAYMAGFYENMQLEDLSYMPANVNYLSMFADEAIPSYTWAPYGPYEPVETWWGYSQIYNVNSFIANLPVYGQSLGASEITALTAEARFIRAFDYFAMVKRYGGIPLITQPQTYTGSNLAQLQVPRDKEQTIYDFIASECDAIANQLPTNLKTNGTINRANKWAALALKSRAMLYAASIAEYGSVQLNGVVGIPANLANSYWQKAYDAADTIITKSGCSLYNANADPALNFQQLFINGDASSNPESIFVESFTGPQHGEDFDFYNQPNPFWTNYSSLTNPTVAMVEEFEYTDGSPGTLKITDASGNPILYNSPDALFANKDPRLFGSIITPNTPWAYNSISRNVELRRGIIVNGQQITAATDNPADPTNIYGTPPYQINIVGTSGPLTTIGDATKTGFYIKKFLTENVNATANTSNYNSSIPWIVFRYGEVLLNFAEAATELGKSSDAKMAMDLIRARAGIVTRSSYTRDQVRHERKVELAFENQRYWDLRRWRIATTAINNLQSYALMPWLMWQPNTPISQMKYTFTIVPTSKGPLTFLNKNYYEPIASGDLQSNPSLVQNPGY